MGNLFGSVLLHIHTLYLYKLIVYFYILLGGRGFRIRGVEDNFFLFLRSLLWELWTPNLLFQSSIVGLKILKKWFMPQVYINGTFKFDQKRNCPPSNGLNFFGRFLLSTLPLFLPPKHSGVGGGWGGGWKGFLWHKYPFSYVAKEKIDPHNPLGVFPQPVWGRSHIM